MWLFRSRIDGKIELDWHLHGVTLYTWSLVDGKHDCILEASSCPKLLTNG